MHCNNCEHVLRVFKCARDLHPIDQLWLKCTLGRKKDECSFNRGRYREPVFESATVEEAHAIKDDFLSQNEIDKMIQDHKNST